MPEGKGYKVKRKKPYSQSGPETKRATGTTPMGVRKPNKNAARTVIRKTTKSKYGSTPRNKQAPILGKITPKRKAPYSEQDPDRKTQGKANVTMIGNPTWRKAKHSLQNPDRDKGGKNIRKIANKKAK